MLIDCDIEPEGRQAINKMLAKTTCLRDLQAALDDEAVGVELDFSRIGDIEIKAAAGMFFGLCRSVDVESFPKTFQFCFGLFEILNAEFERRRGQINAN